MPSYDVQIMPDEPVVVWKTHPDYRINEHLIDSIYAVHDVLDQQGDAVFLVLDYSEHYNPEYQEILDSSAVMAIGDQAILHHTAIREVIAVTDNAMMKLAFEGLAAESFGSVNIQVFPTLDAGLAHIHS